MANEQNLKPFNALTEKEQREIAKKGGKASVKAKKEKKFMSQIYAEFLLKEHTILSKEGLPEKVTGDQLLNKVMSKVLSRGDSAAVSLMKEIREATEGNKINISTEPEALSIQFLPVTTEKDDSKISG